MLRNIYNRTATQSLNMLMYFNNNNDNNGSYFINTLKYDNIVDVENDEGGGGDGGGDTDTQTYLWVIILVNVVIVTGAVFIAAFCCRRVGSGFSAGDGPYNYLPKPWPNQISLHSSNNTVFRLAHRDSRINIDPMMSTDYNLHDDDDRDSNLFVPTRSLITSAPNAVGSDYRDYSTARDQIESQLLSRPEGAECHLIGEHQLDLRQRLGGGIFGDSYLALWHKRKVVAKRIVVGLHGNQQSSIDAKYKFIVQSVTLLTKLRHNNLIPVLGVCIETRQPYIIHNFLDGICLKTVLKNRVAMEEDMNWKRKMKIGRQIADAMSYLHSLNPPILHRDLRCANVFIYSSFKVKLGDFGLTRIFQVLRNQCEGGKNCFCEKSTSALPSTIRWTAPEVLQNPRCEEPSAFSFLNPLHRSTNQLTPSVHNSSNRSLTGSAPAATDGSNCSIPEVLGPACDVYSFGMLMWELMSHADPFSDVTDEAEVLNLVIGGYRPCIPSHLSSSTSLPSSPTFSYPSPHYRDIMELCWDSRPEVRPTFKQIFVSFKSMGQLMEKGQDKQQNQENTTNYYLKSALNVA